jgi:hypothetical protein
MDEKAKRTVEFERSLKSFILKAGEEGGLSVHQIVGAMRAVEHEFLNWWHVQKDLPLTPAKSKPKIKS